jgi:preprotein translocase subunit SecA
MQLQAFNVPMSAVSVFWKINYVDIIAETFKTVSVANATKMSRRSEDIKLFHRIN